MDIQKIKELALANGFKLKEQASGNMDLNAYVYDFANAIEQAAQAQAVPEGFVLVNAESLALHAKSIRMFNNSEEEDDYCEIENHVCAIEAMIEAQEQSK